MLDITPQDALGATLRHPFGRGEGCVGMAEQARQHGQLAGSARLVLVQGPALLHPERTVFDAMLAGWQAQQRSRLLADTTVLWRERIVRRFAEFANAFPWSWTASDVEDWTSSLLSRNGHAHATIRSYQGAVACFLDYVVDARYGWAAECEARFGTHPVQICHEWNTAVHVADYEGRPGRRPFTRAELQAFFDYADDRVGAARAAGRKGWLAAFRDATLFKVTYAWGLRRRESAMLDVADFTHQSGGSAVGSVRHVGGALRQGDARVTPAAAAGRHGDAMGGRGGRGIRDRCPALLCRLGASRAVSHRTGRADLGAPGRRAIRRLPGWCGPAGQSHAALPAALLHFAPHRRRCRPDICATPGRSFLGLDDGRLHHGRRRSRQPDAARGCRAGVCCCAAGGFAMSRDVGYRWHLRLRMAERGMFATTELGPLLAERGVVLSREQVYRLAAGTPERLSLHTLAALCDILECTPSDLIEPVVESKSGAKRVSGAKASVAHAVPRELRPKRARIIADTEEPTVSAGAARLCGRCGRVRPISQRAGPNGLDICSSCWRPPTAVCTVCGDERPCSGVAAGRPICSRCRPRRTSQCAHCGATRPAAARWPEGPICDPCYTAALRRTGTCTRCGRHRRLVAPPGPAANTCAACSGAGPAGHVCTRLRRRRQALHPRLLRPMHPGAAHRRVARRPQRHRAQHACRGARRHRGDQHPTHRAELAAQGSRGCDPGRARARRHRADP